MLTLLSAVLSKLSYCHVYIIKLYCILYRTIVQYIPYHTNSLFYSHIVIYYSTYLNVFHCTKMLMCTPYCIAVHPILLQSIPQCFAVHTFVYCMQCKPHCSALHTLLYCIAGTAVLQYITYRDALHPTKLSALPTVLQYITYSAAVHNLQRCSAYPTALQCITCSAKPAQCITYNAAVHNLQHCSA